MAISTIDQTGLNAPLTLNSPVISTITNGGTLTLPTATGTIISTGNPQSGGVIQTVSYTLTSPASTTNGPGSPAATGLTASISPKFSTSKVLVRASFAAWNTNYSASNCYTFLTRNGTYINSTSPSAAGNFFMICNGTGNGRTGNYITELLDSPATTGSLTYAVLLAADVSSGTTSYFNTIYSYGASPTSSSLCATITLMEIAA